QAVALQVALGSEVALAHALHEVAIQELGQPGAHPELVEARLVIRHVHRFAAQAPRENPAAGARGKIDLPRRARDFRRDVTGAVTGADGGDALPRGGDGVLRGPVGLAVDEGDSQTRLAREGGRPARALVVAVADGDGVKEPRPPPGAPPLPLAP